MPLKREMSPGFCSGGPFSLDGFQLANTLVEAINAKYGAIVPVVNLGTYGAVTPCDPWLKLKRRMNSGVFLFKVVS